MKNTDRDIFVAQELKNIYCEEKFMVREFEQMTEDISLQKLKEVFKKYEELTWEQTCKIAVLFNKLEETPEEKQSAALEKITKEIEQGLYEMSYNTFTRTDVVMRCQRIHHYKMMICNNSLQQANSLNRKTTSPIPYSSNGMEKEPEASLITAVKNGFSNGFGL